MSEERKIKDIEEILELVKSDLIEENKNITAILDYDDLVSLQCLIGLYKQEKEKNNYLKKQIPTDKIFYYSEKDFISKDKIKEKRNELIYKERTSKLEMGNLYRYGIAVLNSVLEEK